MFEELKRAYRIWRIKRARDKLVKAMEEHFGPLQDPNDPNSTKTYVTPYGIFIDDPKKPEHLLEAGLWMSDIAEKRFHRFRPRVVDGKLELWDTKLNRVHDSMKDVFIKDEDL